MSARRMDPEEFGLRREATMPGRRRTAIGITGVLSLAVVVGLADPDLSVRAAGLVEVGRLWGWWPGRTPQKAELDVIAEWKGGLHVPVLRCLAEPSPKVRTAAVACLGLLPIDAAAAPAIPY